MPGEEFEEIIEEERARVGAKTDAEMTAEGWQRCAERFMELAQRHTGQPFPMDPYKQLELGIEAVFKSWNGKRAVDYRNHYGYPHTWGTAANIVTMVYGNFADGKSGTGVAFTRNPATGEKKFYGEYLLNAQGEDVVSGARTPTEISGLAKEIPEAWEELMRVADILEKHYRETQDIEFTIEHGKLWMLQTRSGKRTAAAAVKIAVDMVDEGLITPAEAVARIAPDMIDQLLHPRFDEKVLKTIPPVAKGLNASPGAAVGKVLTALRGVLVVLDQHAVAEFAEPRAAPDRTVADLAERMQDSLQAASAGLAERRFDPPQSLKDWEHLAAIIEKAPDR